MIKRRINSETKEFWNNADKATANVDKWPDWKKEAGKEMFNSLNSTKEQNNAGAS